MGYDRFSIYGFGIDYPDLWTIELNPKSLHRKGDVAFKSPHGAKIFVSWGPLEEATKKYPTIEAHANGSVDQLKRNRDVKKISMIERKRIELSGHEAVYSHFVATIVVGFMAQSQGERELISAHLHCDESRRYFVLYGAASTPENMVEQKEVFSPMRESFACHNSAKR